MNFIVTIKKVQENTVEVIILVVANFLVKDGAVDNMNDVKDVVEDVINDVENNVLVVQVHVYFGMINDLVYYFINYFGSSI